MGLFSSKKKHFVDTSVVRVVEDELVPNVLLTATVESVLKDTRATQTILDQALHGNFRKVERDRLMQLERENRELTGR